MSITPQAIKDQEFQVKFRGYDAIEVKAYLELLAEEFFELHEARSRQEEEYDELQEQHKALQEENDRLAEETREREKEMAGNSQRLEEKDGEIGGLKEKIDKFEADARAAEEKTEKELKAFSEREGGLLAEIEELKQQLQGEKDKAAEQLREKDKLQTEISFLERQIADLRTDDVEFKSTIVAAQKFADDVKNKAEEEAFKLIEEAQEEVEMFRKEAEERLSSLPIQIEELEARKIRVRDELRNILHSYLEQLDDETHGAAPNNGEDMSDLFLSIPLDEDGNPIEEAAGENPLS